MQQHESGSLFGVKRRERGSLKKMENIFFRVRYLYTKLEMIQWEKLQKKHCYSITKTEQHLLICKVTKLVEQIACHPIKCLK